LKISGPLLSPPPPNSLNLGELKMRGLKDMIPLQISSNPSPSPSKKNPNKVD
jgi:hypothetical protein